MQTGDAVTLKMPTKGSQRVSLDVEHRSAGQSGRLLPSAMPATSRSKEATTEIVGHDGTMVGIKRETRSKSVCACVRACMRVCGERWRDAMLMLVG